MLRDEDRRGEGGLAPRSSAKPNEVGQVFLIVILVMVIALTVGLSVASRNIVSLRTSREEKDSQRALAAAEAGIEQSLKTGSSVLITSFTGDPDTTFLTSVSQVLGTQFLVHGDNLIPKDEGADVWLVDHDPSTGDPIFSSSWSGNITIYWGDESGACNNAAVEIAVVSGTVISPVVTRSTHDPCATRRSGNNFSAALNGPFAVSGKTFHFSTPAISVTSGFLVRVVPLYASSDIGITASIALPSQGTVIDATGESSGTSRKIKVFKGYPSLPSQFFLYGLFSP